MANILLPNQYSYLDSLTTKKNELTKRMEKFAKENSIPILEDISADFLEQLVYMYSPKKCLEIGMAIGYSTIRVAKNLKNDAKIDTIEFSKQNIKWAQSYIKQSGFSSKIKIIDGDARVVMKDMSPKYDFIFLDADKKYYLELFELALKLLVKDGVILVDNLLWQGFAASQEVPEKYKKSTEFIREFNAKFLTTSNLKATILPIGDGLGLGIKTN